MANLKYGDKEIDQQQFLEAAANNVQSYINSQPWTKKTKEKWINAYSDLMSKGITGASISQNGIWQIDYSAQQMDQSNMSQRDKDIYKDAAWFIKKQMESIGEVKPEEEKKSPAFSNEAFVNGFNRQISNDLFGGQKWTTQDNWNVLDERGENGLRGTDKRREQLALVLEQYAKSIKEGDYDFTDSPFADYNDLQAKIGAAITALRDPNGDYKTALNRVGINPNNYFYDGSGDVYGTDAEGNSITYGQYYGTIKPQLEATELKQKQELEAQESEKQKKAEEELQSKLFNSVESSNPIHIAWNSKQLADQFGGDLSQATNFLVQLAQSPQKISGANWGIAKGLFKFYNQQGQLKALSDEEKQLFKNLPQYANSVSRLRKIEGVDGLYYDPTLDRVIRGRNGSGNLQDTFASNKSMTEQEFLNSQIPGLTSADKKDLWAIGLDIASIIDPEAISGAVLGAGAAELRRQAANDTPGHKWGFWESVGQGFDYLTGAIGGIPLVGDTILGAKVAKGIAKITPLLRKMARAGAWKDMFDGVFSQNSAVLSTYNKLVNGEDLTVGDWKAIGQLIRGLAGHRALNRSNLAERRTLEKSGYDLSGADKWHQKVGLSRTKLGTTEEAITNTAKIKVDGKETEIKLTDDSAKQLNEKFKKAGHNQTKRNEAVNELKEVKEKYNGKEVKATDATIRDYKLSPFKRNPVNTNQKGKARKYWEWLTETGLESPHNLNNVNRGEDQFDKYLSERGFWDRVAYGTDKQLQRVREGLGLKGLDSKPRYITPNAKVEQRTSKTPNEILELNSPLRNMNIRTNNINDADIHKIVSPSETMNIQFKDGRININGQPLKGTLLQQKQQLGRRIVEIQNRMREQHGDDKLYKEFIKQIEILARNNFLYKHGGRLNNRTKIKIV